MDGRQARGRALALAQPQRIKQVEGPLWFVPSEKAGKGYLINVETGTCTCPDHTGQRAKCKHLHAVEAARSGGPQLALPATTPAKRQPKGDLTAEEQGHVRAALRFLRTRAGGWDALAKGTRFTAISLRHIAYGRPPGARLAVRLARFAGVTVDDLLTGRFPPPGSCPHCGRGPVSMPSGPAKGDTCSTM